MRFKLSMADNSSCSGPEYIDETTIDGLNSQCESPYIVSAGQASSYSGMSLPSDIGSGSGYGNSHGFDSESASEDEEKEIEREWRENMEQLQLMLTAVALPLLGRWLGRRFSHWGTSVGVLQSWRLWAYGMAAVVWRVYSNAERPWTALLRSPPSK